MKLDKNIYKYVEHELYNYNNSKKELEDLKYEVIEFSKKSDGLPKGNNISNPTEDKVFKIIENERITYLSKIIKNIDHVLNNLDEIYRKLFKLKYIEKNTAKYIFRELNISERTYYNYKNNIVLKVAKRLGIEK